jgi:hypothetical protein
VAGGPGQAGAPGEGPGTGVAAQQVEFPVPHTPDASPGHKP